MDRRHSVAALSPWVISGLAAKEQLDRPEGHLLLAPHSGSVSVRHDGALLLLLHEALDVMAALLATANLSEPAFPMRAPTSPLASCADVLILMASAERISPVTPHRAPRMYPSQEPTVISDVTVVLMIVSGVDGSVEDVALSRAA